MRDASALRPLVVHALFFVSGATALLLETLQVAALTRVFGQGPQAAAATLSALFLGLALGAWTWGRWSTRFRRPLRTYGLLELAVALTAGLGLVLSEAQRTIHAAWSGTLGPGSGLLLALLVVGTPSFFLGGTLPVLGAHVAGRHPDVGRRASLLYAVNTAGAAVGCVLGGFLLPPLLGYRATWLLTMSATAVVGLTALALREPGAPARVDRPLVRTPAPLAALAFAVGFLALALQVVWTRLFAQTFENTVQTFAVIVALYLLALALAGGLARWLAGRSWSPRSVLAGLLSLAGLLVALSGGVLVLRTNGLERAAVGAGWAAYLVEAVVTTALALGPAVLVLGGVFPYLWRATEGEGGSPGRVIGALAGWNTLGAALGALAAGFLLLPGWGAWTTLRAASVACALLGLAWAVRAKRRGLLLAGWTVLVATTVPLVVGEQPRWTRHGEVLLGAWEGQAGTVSVVDREGVKKLRFNGIFTIGGAEDNRWEALQTHVALLPAPRVNRVFYLGMGTGITAGAALEHPVDRVVVAELVPEVVEAARTWFAAEANGLFEDPRVEIVTADARHRLAVDTGRYDVIIGDLFFPWQVGTADLYTVEHFRAVKARLGRQGRFVQWLPCHQLTDLEFRAIARTMTEVFELVTLWRGDFSVKRPLLALVGHRSPSALDPRVLVGNARALARASDEPIRLVRPATSLPFFFYVGNLVAGRALLADAPLHTDDRPWLQWEAPRTQRRREAGEVPAFTGRTLLAFERALQAAAPLDADPHLVLLSDAQRRGVQAGTALREHAVARAERDTEAARRALDRYVRLVPEAERPAPGDWVE